jgi:hypothetical protein
VQVLKTGDLLTELRWVLSPNPRSVGVDTILLLWVADNSTYTCVITSRNPSPDANDDGRAIITRARTASDFFLCAVMAGFGSGQLLLFMCEGAGEMVEGNKGCYTRRDGILEK